MPATTFPPATRAAAPRDAAVCVCRTHRGPGERSRAAAQLGAAGFTAVLSLAVPGGQGTTT